MINKIFNLVLALIFLTLVLLFAYKQLKTPEILNVPILDSVASNNSNDKVSYNQNNKPAENNISNDKKQEILSKDDVNHLIEDYIMQKPEVIVASLEALHKTRMEESVKKANEYLKQNEELIEHEGSPPVLGNPDGDIQIVVFYDYNCSFCKKANENESKLIASDPGIKLILRPIPILGEGSFYATKVALALHKISGNNFDKIHNDLIQLKEINKSAVEKLLTKYDIDYNIVENEVNSYAAKQIINTNFEFAKKLGANGTPSYVINGNFVPGLISLDKLKSIITHIRATENASTVKKKEPAKQEESTGKKEEQAEQEESTVKKEEPVKQEEPAEQEESNGKKEE
jgi:protein-disulfide isomerase